MAHVLSKALTAYPSMDKYAPELRERLEMFKEMAAYAEEVHPISKELYGMGCAWEQALSIVTHYGHGVYSFPYLSEAFCKDLMLELDCMMFHVNHEEPEEAQIPEVVLQSECSVLYECLRSLWANAGIPLAKVLLGQDPEFLRTIQAAKYTPENTPRGHWHTDRDSDCTLVIALTADHEGGGTVVHRGPFEDRVVLRQLPVGHAMFFNGKAHRHYGSPVTAGERNLLVHWSEVK